MSDNRHQKLIAKYNAGQASADELREIEQLLAKNVLDLRDLDDVSLLDSRIAAMPEPAPSTDLDSRFYRMLADEKRALNSRPSWNSIVTIRGIIPRLAFGVTLLAVGFMVGYFMQMPSQKTEISSLTREVSDLKEMMMLSLLEKESASERLRAVSLTEEMNDASTTVTQALIHTLNNDANINVRLAALDALKPYTKDPHIREELVRSIGKQDSPLVQIALSELMEALQEKSSVKELKKILQDKNTPRDVRSKIRKTITVLT